MLSGIVLALAVAICGFAFIFYSPFTYAVLSASSHGPDLSFEARQIGGVPVPYPLEFSGFPAADLCGVWANGAGTVERLTSTGRVHAVAYSLEEGAAIQQVGNDERFGDSGNYNNVALFCDLPGIETGETLVVESRMMFRNMYGSAGLYVHTPAIDAQGNINPGGFQAVGFSVGGEFIETKIGAGLQFQEIWGWGPIQGTQISPDVAEDWATYRLEISANGAGQVASLFVGGKPMGALEIKHPLAGNLQLQIWSDNYKTPAWFYPLGFGNVPEGETQEVLVDFVRTSKK